ncbi:hypothetical protein SeMB42_g00313 [Synchytrium endobioticum]|uniref:Piwi domain-containing protein n=1 Tax=Synchytrium endobioticum TaxID=286115 RepID=A0A507DB91_9FUNG|nr:hypothetical protein SeLEV6574_g01849 [Synchytrium endobioticum]TPX54360.1 hypothetical protein SeMB42_g00313 [Synchytrium endobioticum]
MGDRGRGRGGRGDYGGSRGGFDGGRGGRGGGGRGGRGDYGGSRGDIGGGSSSSLSVVSKPLHQGPIPAVKINVPAQIERRGIITNAGQLPYRPNYGSKGRQILLFANFFRMKYPTDMVYQYDYSMTPNAPKPVKRIIFEAWKTKYADAVEPGLKTTVQHLIFDGEKNFYSMKTLPFQKQEFTVEASDSPEDQRARTYTLQMQATTRVDLSTLEPYLNHDGKGAQPELPRNAIQVLEILIRHVPALLFTTVGRNSYYLKDQPGQSIRDGLMVHLGWFQSIRPALGQLVLNLDVSATAFYEVEPVDKLVAHFFGAQAIMPLWKNLRPAQTGLISRFLRHVVAELNYQPAGSRRKYKITGLDNQPAGQRRVPYGPDDKEHPPNETVAQYYLRVHNIRLQFPDIPCVTAGTTRTVYLPMELLTVRAGQRHLGQLKPEQLAEMIKVTSTTPDDRLRRIVDGDVALHRNPKISSFLQGWGLQIEDKMAQVTGRILDAPNITVGGRPTQPREGSWSAQGFAIPANVILQNWSICIMDGQIKDYEYRAVENFRRVLVETLVKKGMNVTNREPAIFDATSHGPTNVRGILLDAGKAALRGQKGIAPQLVVCVLYRKNSPMYPEIKRVAETDLGVMTQCVVLPNLTKDRGIEMYCENVSLKVNAKLGGINSYLDPDRGELTRFAANIPTMLIGADVTHPRPGSHGHSIAAVVGSMDKRFCHYNAAIRSQQSRQEIISEMKDAVKQLFVAFKDRSKVYPQRVVFFRDGVSEGQFNEVTLKEVRDFKQACQELGITNNVTLTFIVVTKRHHARFVPVNRADGDRKNGNALPGTTIDNSIVHPFAFDYYQFGSQGLLGTSRPAHYTVLFDEHKFDADTLQEFTFRLCHLYARCNKSISLVPPAQYAHLLASRARHYAPEVSASASTASPSQAEGGGPREALKAIKRELADKMFFT